MSAVDPKPATSFIPERDRVPAKQKAAYAMGVVADFYSTYGLNGLILPVYNVILGLSPTLVSVAIALSRLWDAMIDPAVGSLSDNCRSKFGRRKPFLFAGAILTGCFFPVIWLVPEAWGDGAKFTYLCVSLLIFYTFYSFISIPYESLGMELTANYLERTNVYAVRTYVEKGFSLGIPWLFALANLAMFGGVLSGVKIVGVLVGIVIIITGCIPALFCIERYGVLTKQQKIESAFTTLKSLSSNRPLLVVVSATSLFLLALTSVQAMDFYLHTYYIYEGDIKQGAMLTGYNGMMVVFSVLGAYLVQRASKRFDKHHILLVCIAVIFLCKLGLFFTYVPGRPYLTLVTKPFLAIASTGFWILAVSMKADIADWDEYIIGRRREGMIAAVNSWFVKVAITIAFLAGGLILQYVVGFDRDLGGNQSPATLHRMLVAYATIPSVAMLAVFMIVRKYSLTAAKLRAVRAELELRRQAV